MSKKNSLAKRRKQHQYQIRLEKHMEQEAQKRVEKREAKGEYKKLEKRAKVEPVQGSKVKKQKMALAKQLKSMSIGNTKKEGIHRKLSQSSGDESGSDMEVDQVGGQKLNLGESSKGIKKNFSTPKISRATFLEMKKH